MGTVVEQFRLPLPDLQDDTGANSRTSPAEVIDVDAHEASVAIPSVSRGGPRIRPAFRARHPFDMQSERETISLLDDSEDEVQILPEPTRENRGEVHNRRHIRSPPPFNPGVVVDPPPVPPIPARFAGFASFPVAPLSPHLPAPPIRPNVQPFAFEQQLDQRQQPHGGPSNQQPLPYPRGEGGPFAAPPSHHTPVMGLGGALISSNTARAQHAAAAARLAHMRNHQLRRRPNNNAWLNPDLEDFVLRNPDNERGPNIRRWIDAQQENILRLYHRFRNNREPPSPPKYLQSYTHPGGAVPGFTFDFAPNASDEGSSQDLRFPATSVNAPILIDDDDDDDDDDEVTVTSTIRPSADSPADAATTWSASSATSAFEKSETPTESGKLSVLLVCARCMEPLLVNESLGPDDNGRRVWALRCGHLIDERCLNEIGQPEEDSEPKVQAQSPTPDKKGKGKAKAKQRASYGEAAVKGVVVDTTTNSIRSRLRSAVAGNATSSSSTLNNPGSSSSLLPPPAPHPTQRPPSKRRRAAGAAAAAVVLVLVPKIEADFEWKCPVPSCGHVHVSVRIDGKWGPEQDGKLGTAAESQTVVRDGDDDAKIKPRGAIPVFA